MLHRRRKPAWCSYRNIKLRKRELPRTR